MKDVFGILLIVTGAASGLLFQDPVVCRFTESKQCYVALGQRLHLLMPREDVLELKFTDKTNTTRIILNRRQTQTNLPRWQFVNDNKTMIVTRAERSNSGNYTVDAFTANGDYKGVYTLQLITEAQVSSVQVSYSCLSPEVMKVDCSADGDNLRFSWSSDLNTHTQLENETSTITLDKNHQGNVTCRVENHVSRDHNTTELHPCSESTTAVVSTTRESGNNLGTNSTTVSLKVTNSSNQTQSPSASSSIINSGFIKLALIILSSVCVLLIMTAILAFYIYRKRQGQKNKEASPQDGGELVYADVTHLPTGRTETRPNTVPAQADEVEYAMVVTHASKRKQKKTEDEVQYGELVFNTPAKNQRGKVQDDCVYSQVQHGR